MLKHVLTLTGAALVVSCVAFPATRATAVTRAQVLEQTVDRTVVRVEAGERGQWRSFAIAIPGPVRPVARIVGSDDSRLDIAPASIPSGRVFVTEPGRVRGLWTSSVHVALEWDDGTGPRRTRSVTIALDHPAQGSYPRTPVDTGGRAPFGAFLNPRVAARFAAAEAAPRVAVPFVEDTFARSPNWVRIEVAEGGIHTIDYAALRAVLGLAVDVVDPATLRLFSARHRVQPPAPSTAGSSWEPALGLREHAIHVRADEATLVPGDEVVMLLTGVEGWDDEYDPDAHWLDHDENTWATRQSFWLTWDEVGGEPGDFPAAPLRMAIVDAAPSGTPDRILADVRRRTHAEENIEPGFGHTEDKWMWTSFIRRNESRTHAFESPSAIADSVLWVRTRPAAEVNGALLEEGVQITVFAADYEISDVYAATANWSRIAQQVPGGTWFRFPFVGLQSGANDIRVRNVTMDGINSRSPAIYVDAFDLHWRSHLRPDPAGRIDWVIPEAEASAGRWRYQVSDPAQRLANAVLLDTTEPFAPRWLEPGAGRISSGAIEFDVDVGEAAFAKFRLAAESGTRSPLLMERHRPGLLRDDVRLPGGESADGYDYLVVSPSEFLSASEDLADLRRRDLEGSSGARVAVVDLQDVYDQFGHGSKDPAAIRNYAKFLYEIDPRLRFVALMGDANRDSRGLIPNSTVDWCPTFVESAWPYIPDSGPSRNDALMPFARDDWLVSLDDPVYRANDFDLDLPDLGIGRFPVASPSEAARMVDMVRDYVEAPASGTWRNEILLAADDECCGYSDWETDHVEQGEVIAEELLPRAMDREKIYLTDYVNVGSARSKPAARRDFVEAWSDGRLIVHYIGHGSPQQLADEVLFRIEDVTSLRNAERRGLFLAFSCDVAIFDDPTVQSMSEALVLSPIGGAIATIAATYVTYVGANEGLTDAFYGRLYPEGPGSLTPRPTLGRAAAIGTALTEAKTIGAPATSIYRQRNDAKYVILGDPALRLQSPEEDAELSGDLTQRILTGQLERLEATAPSVATGTWHLMAQESADSVTYHEPGDGLREMEYVIPGGAFYSGGGPFSGGTAEATLRTPAVMRLGGPGRVRMLLDDGDRMHVALADSLPVEKGAADTDDQAGPVIEFMDYRPGQSLRPGQELVAAIEDSSGVNVLGSVAGNSILVDFDESGVSVDLTDRFALDESSYTRGIVSITIPDDLGPGGHTLSLSAGDMIGNVSVRRLEFELADVTRTGIARHAPFPNPFRDRTRFVVEVNSTMPGAVELTLDLYTVGGAPVASLTGSIDGGGRLALPWDGRDRLGDELANGTYLYVIRARFGGSPPFTETATGRVVLMR